MINEKLVKESLVGLLKYKSNNEIVVEKIAKFQEGVSYLEIHHSHIPLQGNLILTKSMHHFFNLLKEESKISGSFYVERGVSES